MSAPTHTTGTGVRHATFAVTALWLLFLVALVAAYSNHFDNSFHFDDSHTVVGNAYIRDLRNVSGFFTDARTATPSPEHHIYRPLVTTSLAVDYWLGGGLHPRWFHASTFLWYVVLLVVMYHLFLRIMDSARPGPGNRYIALFATAAYGLHPVSAETVNYVYQRGDLYATLGVVAALAIYAARPRWRRYGVYLVPAAAGMLAKQTGIAFAPLLSVYILLFESDRFQETDPAEGSKTRFLDHAWPAIVDAARRSIPAFVLAAGYYVLQDRMTPSSFSPGATSRLHYWYTQPFVLLHYFKSFFLPTELTADTDRELVTTLFSDEAVIGIGFLMLVAGVIWKTLWLKEHRPVAFGLIWFLVASLPTSLFPLAEAENDHRMFFPFVGVVLAVCWGATTFLHREPRGQALTPSQHILLVAFPVLVLLAFGYGTHRRNEVWRSEETLWRDVVQKSPRNGRGLMNYGVQLMARGDYQGALSHFERAQFYTPSYSTLHVNLAIAYGGVRRSAEAEQHFRLAQTLAPGRSDSYFYYGRWLKEQARLTEAVATLRRAVELNRDDLNSAHLLMQVYLEQGDNASLKKIAAETFRRFPSDLQSARYETAGPRAPLVDAEIAARANPTPEKLLDLSLYHEQAGRHEECIAAAREALRLRPNYAAAYNNIAAAYAAMKQWKPAIEAAREAVALDPGFQLAKNNLQYALEQQKLEEASRVSR